MARKSGSLTNYTKKPIGRSGELPKTNSVSKRQKVRIENIIQQAGATEAMENIDGPAMHYIRRTRKTKETINGTVSYLTAGRKIMIMMT